MARTRSQLREESRLIATSETIEELDRLRESLRRRLARGLRRKGHADARRLAELACAGMYRELPAEFRRIGMKAGRTCLAILGRHVEVSEEWGFGGIRLEVDGDYSPIEVSGARGMFPLLLTTHEERPTASVLPDYTDVNHWRPTLLELYGDGFTGGGMR